jgi:hypothetical protein
MNVGGNVYATELLKSLVLERMEVPKLSARGQLSVPHVTNLQAEPSSMHRLYGTADPNPLKAAYARNCLLAGRPMSTATSCGRSSRDYFSVSTICPMKSAGGATMQVRQAWR